MVDGPKTSSVTQQGLYNDLGSWVKKSFVLKNTSFLIQVGYETALDGLAFPNLTVCSFNPFNKSRMAENNISEKLGKFDSKSE